MVTELVNNLHFLRPVWLLGLVALPLLYAMLAAAGGALRDWRRIADPELLDYLSVGAARRRRAWTRFGLLALWATACIAAAGPSWRQAPGGLYRQVAATVAVMDLSRSMTAPDLKPSRLERARFKLIDLLQRYEEGQIGLIAFAGEPFIVSPLTDDARTIENLVAALSPDIMPAGGSDPGEALELAAALIRQIGSGQGDILLFTDAVRPNALEVARELASEGIRLSVFGVGTPDGAPIPDGEGGVLRAPDGSIVIPRLEEAGLRELARLGNGVYQRMRPGYADIEAFLALRDTPLGGEFAATDAERSRWIDEGPWLVLLLLPFAALAFRRGVLLGLACLAVMPIESGAAAWSQPWLNREQQADEALEAGQYEKAAELSESPLRRGNALFRAGEFEAAARAYASAQGPEGSYNRGNALARQERYEEAIAAYDQALELDPNHEDARFNKELLEKLLEEQQQQEQEQQDQQNQQEQQDQENAEQQDSQQSESDQGEQETEAQQQQEEAEESEEQDGERSEEEMELSEQELDQEQKQALEQWLRRIPDDPGGLLRRKFLLEYQRRGSPPPSDNEDW